MKGAREDFLERLSEDEPTALAIMNELTGPEIDEAFAWEKRRYADAAEEAEAHPVSAYLSAAQAECVRVRIVATDEADTAVELATKEYTPPGARYPIRAKDRVGIGEAVFAEWMVDDAAEHRGGSFALKEEESIDAIVDGLPEPWRGQTRRRLEEVRRTIREMLDDAEEK